jgi:phage anti-repressor protein
MTDSIVVQDTQALIDLWIEAERYGNPFPVDFDLAWDIAGYSTKGNAKKKLVAASSGLIEGEDFTLLRLDKPDNHAGFSAQELARIAATEKISLTCDAFKQFCLMAKTAKGKEIRLYFISAEKSWKESQKTRRLTSEEVANICLLPSARNWEKRFGDKYYEELSRLTGLVQDGNLRPQRWAQLTDEWVYCMLPVGVRDKVRAARKEQGGWQRLHQFLSDDGLAVFERHMETLLIIMMSSESVNGVRRGLRTLTATQYQMNLLDDSRKDGVITLSRRALDNQN